MPLEQAAFLFSGVGGMLLTEMEISNTRNITHIARRLAWINAKRTHIDIPSYAELLFSGQKALFIEQYNYCLINK
ncbi:hypothetical protein CJZ35_25970, partial [Salmonella enterica subsp. enterica serovar Braenderup]|uniref:hypothetical protein n=1 Tax=Salmonella enterica TaxID=28901 RepID=UPI000BCA500E